MRHLATAIVLVVGPLTAFAEETEKLVIHEWGTFTSLQDEAGRSLGGINTDDEPVPAFVHRVGNEALLKQPTANVVSARPDITMRLETPVVYFHPPRGATLPITLDFKATFNGGVLNEFYPLATATAPAGPLQHDTVSTLTWRNLQVGVKGDGPETDDHVWLAPRRVRAANVRSENGETERYLFYRGVGHLESPLIMTSHEGASAPSYWVRREKGLPPESALWLVSVQVDGRVAFSRTSPMTWSMNTMDGRAFMIGARPSLHHENPDKLKQSMKDVLISEGLFEDEADAMLATWEQSYFKTPGQRVFFIAPRAWVDRVLPLEVSVPADITRVFVGRIELVTAEQRALLARIKEGRDVLNAYRALGRFRDALVVDAGVVEQVTAALPQVP